MALMLFFENFNDFYIQSKFKNDSKNIKLTIVKNFLYWFDRTEDIESPITYDIRPYFAYALN